MGAPDTTEQDIEPDTGTSTSGACSGSGSLDTTFNSSGQLTIDHGDSESGVTAMAIDSGGRILVAGESSVGFCLNRFLPDGSIDVGFGTPEDPGTDYCQASQNFGHPHAEPLGLDVERSTGKITAVGYVDAQVSGTWAVARYNADGSLDGSFGGGTVLDTSLLYATSVATLPDNKIVVAGVSGAPEVDQHHVVVVRYNPDGTLDSSFGTAGRFKLTTETLYTKSSAKCFELALQTDGKIVVAANATYFCGQGPMGFCNSGVLVLRLDANGAPDQSFGEGGVARQPVMGFANAHASSVALQPDGKIVVGGWVGFLGPVDVMFMRFDTGGGIDTSFGTGGVFRYDYSGGIGGIDYLNDMALQSDGKIVATGRYWTSPFDAPIRNAIWRLKADGSADNSFNNGAEMLLADLGGKDGDGQKIAVQAGDRIVVGGYVYNSDCDSSVMRICP